MTEGEGGLGKLDYPSPPRPAHLYMIYINLAYSGGTLL